METELSSQLNYNTNVLTLTSDDFALSVLAARAFPTPFVAAAVVVVEGRADVGGRTVVPGRVL
jgi:hypothetical protein